MIYTMPYPPPEQISTALLVLIRSTGHRVEQRVRRWVLQIMVCDHRVGSGMLY